jgi:hypothetical protein
MAAIKSYTDLEQSKKLAEILPLESADMAYIKHLTSDNPNWEFNEDFPPMILGNVSINEMTVAVLPCWSVVSLFCVLPNSEHITTTLSRGGWKIDNTVECLPNTWWCEYEDEENYKEFNISADNPIDAGYEMIIKLHELNLL